MSLKSTGFAMAMLAAAMMGGSVNNPSPYREPERRRTYTPFIIKPELPKGHEFDRIIFELEINGHNISGEVMFTFVRKNKDSYNKRSAARLRELISYLKSTPIDQIKKFNQFTVTPIQNGEIPHR